VTDDQPPRGRRRYQTALLIVAMSAAGFNLRIAVSNLPPLFPDLAARLHLSTVELSLLGATPVLFFGLASAFAAWLNRRHGEERVLLVALAVLAAGLVLRGVAPGALLFPGTALAAGAIAILNVLLASMAKRRWPERAGFLVGIYLTALCVGAILASLLAVPIYHASGDSFRLTLGVWAAPAVLAMLLWLPQLRYAEAGAAQSRSGAAPAMPPVPRIAVQKTALAWQVTAFMGLQSLLYYAVLSWLPTIFQDRGTSAVTAGNLLALMGVGNLIAAPLAPMLAQRTPGQRALVVPSMIAMAVGLAGSVWAPVGTAPLWVLVLGLSQGACLGLAIYFMMARSPDPGTAASMSAFAQSVGYLMASVGPLELGLLHSVTGSWGIPVALLLVLAAAGLGMGVLAARPIVLSVDPARAADQQASAQMRHTRRLRGARHGPSPVCGRKLLPRSRQARTAREEQSIVTLLECINGPEDLKGLSQDQLTRLAAEIRDVLIEWAQGPTVAKTSGHLGPNLGVVELTIAIHRVFDSPTDRIVFDTGHQSYVHKLLTGRFAQFGTLRQRGGLTGYPSQAESEHDLVENSHASTSLSYADGLAKAFKLRGEPDRTVVAVIGDGALTGGMAWEALNNIAAAKDSRIIMIVNDNGWSYQPTIGGLAEHLAAIRVNPRYEHVLHYIKTTVSRAPLVGAPLYGTLHGIKKGIKDVLQPQVMFEDLGLKYVGPIDGHDERMLEAALRRARDFGGPVLLHVITKKGFGYAAAEQNEIDCLHQVPAAGAQPGTWSRVFGDEMLAIGARRSDLVAITAAMLYPTGLAQFAQAYPDRTYDVGIAEQHAMTSAAGLAMGGLHPVVAIYSTFLNRAFDQTLMDVALHRLPVTIVLDRAGVTGPDGASHHGMWDGSIMQLVPGMKIAAPRDAKRVAELLNEAVEVSDGPTVVRFPKGKVGGEVEAIGKLGGMDVLRTPSDGLGLDVLFAGAGPMALAGLEVADRLADHGIGVTVVDPRWTKPVDEALAGAARQHRLVVAVEDNGRVGGFGDAVARLLRDHDVDVPVKTFGLPQEFLSHGTREEVLDEAGLTPQQLALRITEAVARRSSGEAPETQDAAPEGRTVE
jgi:1-deoxy-D-xylulose-5-phosphate synthase